MDHLTARDELVGVHDGLVHVQKREPPEETSSTSLKEAHGREGAPRIHLLSKRSDANVLQLLLNHLNEA